MTLKFSEKAHRYWLNGKPVKGVTTLLKDGLPKPALMYWSARTVAEYVADNEDGVAQLRLMGREPMVAALKGVPWEKRDQAAIRGTDVHALAERIVHGEAVEVPAHLEAHVRGYVDWLDAFDLTPVLTECSVASESLWYAGRFDLIADLGGVRWLLDVKTSSDIYGETAMQCDAYRNAEFYVTDDDPNTHLPLPEGIERIGALHVTDAGTTLYPFDSTGEPFRIFKHIAFVAKQKDAIDKFKHDAIYTVEELSA